MSDNQRYFTLLTDKGKFKIAKATADKGEVKFSHFAIGDGGGQEVNPLPSQTGLVHEVWRTQLDSVEIDPKNPAAVIINAIIPHNVGGWWMREFGLFDVDGDMLAVVKPAPYYKATSAEGQLEDVFYEFQLMLGEQAQVVVLVDPTILWATRDYVETRRISASQFMNTPWLPAKSITLTTPPSSNNQGDTYVVPANAKGAWASKTGQLAEWNGKAWNFWQAQDGHGIGLPDGRVLNKVNGQYVELLASRSYVNSYRIPTPQMLNRPFVSIVSASLISPPSSPNPGEAYVIPANATGDWGAPPQYMAEWNGTAWGFALTPNGHCVGLPDGRLLIKVGGTYVEKIAWDSLSGKWSYSEANGSANALTAVVDPKPLAIIAGLSIQIKIRSSNTGSATLNLNSFGAKPIVYHETGEPLIGGDFQAGDVVNLVYDGINWRLQPSLAYMDNRYSRLTAPPTDTYYVLPTGNDNNTGFAATAKDGFKTISGAINAIANRYSTNMQIKIIVSPGTYGGFTIPTSFINSWSIISSTKKASDVAIDAKDLSSNAGRAANIVSGTVNLSYMTFRAYYECIGISSSQVSANISNVNLELAGASSVGISSIGGIAYVTGDIQLSGSTGLSAFRAANGGYIRLGYKDAVSSQAVSINFALGTLRLADASITATQSGTVEIYSAVFYGNGYPTAKKYVARLNGIINTFGGGTGFLPGNTAGSTENGGQYV